jgi:hypothetical protein
MEILDLNEESHDQTFMLYGPSGAGKTELAATFPRPLFLSDGVERGWETIRHMPKEKFYDPNYTPQVIRIKALKDMREAVAQAKTDYAAKKFDTLVIDSLTFYGDLFLDANKEVTDKRSVYGALLTHIRSLMIEVHRIGCGVVWLALDKIEDNGIGGIAIAGQSAIKMPAACMYVFHQGVTYGKGDTAPVYTTYTRAHGPFLCKTRDRSVPPTIEDATYKKIAELSGWKH